MTLSKLPLFHQLTTLSNNHHNKPPPSPCLYLSIPHSLPSFSATSHNRRRIPTPLNCRISSSDDELLSTNSFYREFSVIANMLKKIEPLDASAISNSVSDSVINAMKQRISAMLGLIPLDELSVTVTVIKRHLVRLLASSVITGYTLWNADYRIRLLRNFEKNSADMSNKLNSGSCDDALEFYCHEESVDVRIKELHTQKQETIRIVYTRESSNDLLKYLRSLDSGMVNELSRPSSSEVKEALQQLVHCTSRKVFKEDITTRSTGDSNVRIKENYQNGDAKHRIISESFFSGPKMLWYRHHVTISSTDKDHKSQVENLLKTSERTISCDPFEMMTHRHESYSVYVIRSSIEKFGEQAVSELCSWLLVISS